MLAEHQRGFELFGSHVRIHVGAPTTPGMLDPELGAIAAAGLLRKLHSELSRFDATSALSALNDDPAETVAVTPYVALLVEAAIAAAEATGGLVDPTLIDALEDCGYRSSLVGAVPASLAAAVAVAPRRAPAAPAREQAWRRISVDRSALTVTRPPGVRIDSGGIGKGLAADLGADRLAGYTSFCVDCGGDLRLGGTEELARRVSITHPLTGSEALSFELSSGGVATSGLGSRIWRRGEDFAHHLIDPATGRPAWTALLQATALAPTALVAETLAKAALLAGPEGARQLLADHGGVMVHDSGDVEAVAGLAPSVEPALAA
jgi:thiamine biosynthesis lipoprotein